LDYTGERKGVSGAKEFCGDSRVSVVIFQKEFKILLNPHVSKHCLAVLNSHNST
jgi:hypothetical protein